MVAQEDSLGVHHVSHLRLLFMGHVRYMLHSYQCG